MILLFGLFRALFRPELFKLFRAQHFPVLPVEMRVQLPLGAAPVIAIRARDGLDVFVIIHMPGESVEIVENVLAESAVVSVVRVKHFLVISLVEHGEERLIATLEHLVQLGMHPLDVQQHVVLALGSMVAFGIRTAELTVHFGLDDALGGGQILGYSLDDLGRRMDVRSVGGL